MSDPTISPQAVPAYATFVTQLAGKPLPANFLYAVSSSIFNTSSINGDNFYSGQVAGFTQLEEGGTFEIVNAETGLVSLNGTQYTIMGASTNGQHLILGTTTTKNDPFGTPTTSTSPSIIVSNPGSPPPGSINFNTNFAYQTPTPPCLARGTLVETLSGNVPVESLSVGDQVVTASGPRPIKWIGSTKLRCAGAPWAESIAPIMITRGAFADNAPSKELIVSPGHGIGISILGHVIVPAGLLVNGSSITTSYPEWVEYWHVELDQHDLITAQGMLVESYLDVGNRNLFDIDHLAEPALSLDPTMAQEGNFQRVTEGPILDAVRMRLQDRAEQLGWAITPVEESPHLFVDGLRVEGVSSGDAIRFIVPHKAQKITLASPTFTPASVDPLSRDLRELGVKLVAIEIDDGLDALTFMADHVIFADGFYDVEMLHRAERWTNGCASLPSAMWESVRGDFFVKVQLADKARRSITRSNFNESVRQSA